MERALVITVPDCPKVSVGNLPTMQFGDQWFFSEDDFYGARNPVALRTLRIVVSEALRDVGIRLPVSLEPVKQSELQLFSSLRGIRTSAEIVHVAVAHYYREALHYSELQRVEKEIRLMLFPDLDDVMYDNLYDEMRAMRMADLVDFNIAERMSFVKDQVETAISAGKGRDEVADVKALSVYRKFGAEIRVALDLMQVKRGFELYSFIITVVEALWSFAASEDFRVVWPNFDTVDNISMGEWYLFDDVFAWLKMVYRSYNIARLMYVTQSGLIGYPTDNMKPLVILKQQLFPFIRGPVILNREYYYGYIRGTICCKIDALLNGIVLEQMLHMVDSSLGSSCFVAKVLLHGVETLYKSWNWGLDPTRRRIFCETLWQFLCVKRKVHGTVIIRDFVVDGMFYLQHDEIYFRGINAYMSTVRIRNWNKLENT